MNRYPRIGGFRTAAALRARCTALGIDLPCDEVAAAAPESPLAQPLDAGGARLANRFAIQPMEGWDGTNDGRPTPLTERRWRRFGGSGAALVWGGEAVAVRADGRANPNQLVLADVEVDGLIGDFARAARLAQAEGFDEPIAVVRALAARGVRLLNVTAASPYYAPHAQRPAAFPPSDGYRPPEDPLVGVARLPDAARRVKAAVPEAIVVSSGWSYLQDWLPHAAQATVRAGWFDAVGLGRMALSYPDLPADVLAGRPLDRRRICRTFSECTTAPRQGRVSGCYPLDPFYRARRD